MTESIIDWQEISSAIPQFPLSEDFTSYKFLTCLLHNTYDKSLPVYHSDNYIHTEVIDIFYFIYFLQSN